MARFRCRACAREGTFVYQAGHHECPRCGSRDVQFAFRIEELSDDAPLIDAVRRLAEGYDKNNEN
jgi:hypothetical protein